MKSNISGERAPGETFQEYKKRQKLTKIIIRDYLRNGQRVEESTKEPD